MIEPAASPRAARRDRASRCVVSILPWLLLLSSAAGCGGPAEDAAAEAPESACTQAAKHYEQLRIDALEQDPVLKREPGLAAEHARQTRGVAAAPMLARCLDNDAVGRCVSDATTFSAATACLGG